MAVTLCITSYQKNALGADAEKTFQRSGGSFGRGQANDWVLPDPERILSGRHGSIFFKDDSFWLKDESTNGIAVGARSNKIGKGQAVRLHNGLQLFFGEYEAVVDLENGQNTSPATVGQASSGRRSADFHAANARHNHYQVSAPHPDANGPPGLSAHRGGMQISDGERSCAIHKDRFDPLEAFSSARPSSSDLLTPSRPAQGRHPDGDPIDTKGVAGGTPDDHGSALEDPFVVPGVYRAAEEVRPSADQSGPLLPEDWDATGLSGGASVQPRSQLDSTPGFARSVEPRAARSECPAREEPGTPQKPDGSGDAETFLRLFFDAAGMPEVRVRAGAAPKTLEELGSMFGCLVQGVMTLAKARAETKSELRLTRTALRQHDNNPLKIADDPEDALRLLLGPGASRYLKADQAVKQLVMDLQAHQVALISALQASIDDLIKRVAPEHFAAKSGDSGLFKGLGAGADGAAWQRYKEFYEHALRDSSGAFKTLLGEHFSEAYEEQVQRLNKKQ